MSFRRQFSRFFGVGVLATALDYTVMICARELAGLEPVWAALLGYCCGGLISYSMNRRHTFKSDRTHSETGWRFAIVMGAGFCLTGVAMDVFTGPAGLAYVPARVVTTGLVFLMNFAAHRSWTFRDRAA